ncbi:unnamed protein product, partial [Scytosiphon promiscuus]
MWPSAGPESGGTMITIKGTGFTDMQTIVCEFGSERTLVPGKWMDSTILSCRAPPHMPGAAVLRLTMNGQQFVETGLSFEYLVESTVRSITPPSGPQQGGTLVEVAGTGFVNSTALSCRLAGRRLSATFVDNGRLRCTTPPSTISPLFPSVPLEVSNNGVDFTNGSSVHFTYVPALDIRQLWPTNGPFGGGTFVSVYGARFSGRKNKIHCVFGGDGDRMTQAVVHSDNELSCPTPPHGMPSSTVAVRLELTNNDGADRVASPLNFTYVPPILLSGVSPAQSGEEGGETVVVLGENFIASPSLSCRFGGQEATPAAFISSTQVACLVPASPSGPREVSLTISNNAQDFAGGSPLVFTYVAAFTVIKAEPNAGPVDGGTEVTLTGTGLSEVGPWACIFGDSIAVPAVGLVSGNLRCKSPPHPPGRAGLRVFRSPSPLASAVAGAIAAAASSSLQDFGLSFEYQGTVFISSLEPRSGSTSGGTPVALRGFGFANASSALTCGFGGQDGRVSMSPAVLASSGMAVCSSPPHSSRAESSSRDTSLVGRGNPSVVSVSLSLNGVDFTSRGPQFIYYEPVEVLGVFPTGGCVNGGTVVTVVGRHFLPSEALSCQFGAFAPSSGEYISSDVIRCVAPPSPVGPIKTEVSVSNNLVEFSKPSLSTTFEYHPQARPERFHPKAGPLSGGTVVAIEGGTFTAASAAQAELACRFGRVVVKATLQSPTKIVCRAPRSVDEKNVSVQVTMNGGDWEDVGRDSFAYYHPPEITELHPSTGPRIGGTHLTIFGQNLAPVSPGGPVLCRVGNSSTRSSSHVSTALAWDDASWLAERTAERVVTCKVPDLGADDFTTVEVAVSTDGGVHFSSPPLAFAFVQVPIIHAVRPGASMERGALAITVTGEGFLNLPTLACRFGLANGSQPAEFVSSEHIRCITPSESEPGTVHLEVTLNGVDYTAQETRHTFLPMASLSGVNPVVGLVDGGASIFLEGSGFDALGRGEGMRVTCRWTMPGLDPRQELTTRATVLSDTMLTCLSPPAGQDGGIAHISVLADDVNVADGAGNNLSALTFEYKARATTTKLVPTHGRSFGGTRIRVTGEGFASEGNLTCRFHDAEHPGTRAAAVPAADAGAHGGVVDVPAKFVSANEVHCLSPALASLHGRETENSSSGVGHALLEVINNPWPLVQGYDDNRGLSFWYRHQLKVTKVAPSTGSSECGVRIRVTGGVFRSGDSDSLRCRIGSAMLPAKIVSSRSLSCGPTGPMPPGSFAVAVTDNGVDFEDASTTITFLPGTTVTTISPSSGPFAGSGGRGRLPILLTGTGFSAIDRPSCSFGGTVVDAQEVLSETEARCIPPVMPRLASRSTPLSVPVQFSNNGVDFGDCQDERGRHGGGAEPMFLFYDEPVVTSVTPSRGATNGQESNVLLRGSHLAHEGSTRVAGEDSTLMCRLEHDGHGSSEMGVVLSSTEATCVVSCGDFSGLVSLAVSLNEGVDWTVSDVPFRCDPIPTISSVSPEIGPSTGGTTLTVKGSGFVSGESLSCVVGRGDGNSASTIVQALWISSSAVTCVTPAVSGAFGPTTAEVAVTNDGITFSPPAGASSFTYVSPPMVTRVTPSFASVFGNSSSGRGGGAIITATGTNFVDSPLSSCHFTPVRSNDTGARVGGELGLESRGSMHVMATFISSTEVACRPGVGVLPVGPAMLTVSVNGVDFDDTAGAIIALEALPEVFKVVPSRGMTGPTSTPVEVYGTGFADRPGYLLCRFGETVVEASFASSSVVRCSAPAQAAPGAVDIAVSVDGGATFGGVSSGPSGATSFVHFRYMAPSFVTGISPRSGPDTGGTVVSVLGTGFSRELRFICKFHPEWTFLSSSELACIAPPVVSGDNLGQAVEVAVSVDLGNGQMTSLPPLTESVAGSAPTFTYVPRLQMAHLSPDRGSKEGGTVVNIAGANFLSPLDNPETVWCRFGLDVTIGSLLSDGLVQCSSPPWGIGGATDVEISVSVNSGADFEGGPAGSPLIFTYEDAAQVASVSPAFVPSTGGTRITLTGSGFPRGGDARCRFGAGNQAGGEASANLPLTSYAYVVSAEEIACIIPSPGLGPGKSGSAHLFLATSGDEFRPTNLLVNFVPALEVSSIVPGRVDEQGEHSVLLEGANFPDLPDLACRFGTGVTSSTVPALWLGSTAVRCVTPPLSPGSVTAEVTFNGVDFVQSPQMLMVETKLTVTGVAPPCGPIRGGTEVAITGTGFGADFGSNEGNSSANGGFLCLFGDSRAAAVATILSPGIVSCRTPPGFVNTGIEAFGKVSVIVARRHESGTVGDVSFSPIPLEFLYHRDVVLARVTPDRGPMAGGTRVALSGLHDEILRVRASGVEPDLRCRFGAGKDALIVELQDQGGDEGDAFCVVPPLSGATAGTTNVIVTASLNGGKDFLTSEAVFLYFEDPQVVSVGPSAVPVHGGSTVVLEGRNFPESYDGFKCLVGTGAQASKGVRVSSTVLECVVPPHSPGFVLVSATFNGQDVATSNALLEYREDLSVASISPAYAAVASGARVTLRGTGFVNSPLLSLRWSRQPPRDAIDQGAITGSYAWYTTSLEFVNDTAVAFTAPHVAMHGGEGEVELRLQVSNNGVDFTPVEEQARLAIAGRPRVFSIFPQYGTSAGATVVTVTGTGFIPAATLCRFGSRERDSSRGESVVDEPLVVVRADVRNSTHLTCLTPASPGHLIGEHFIEIVTGASTSDDALAMANTENVYELVDPLASAGFTFIPAAGVISVEPAVLPESGGSVVAIEGYNFTRTGVEACRFGGETVVAAAWWSSSTVECQAPPLPPGFFSLELTLNGGVDWLLVLAGLRYDPDRFVFSLSPSAGPLSGGSRVVISGVGFAAVSVVEEAEGVFYCSFGHLEVVGRALNDTFLECTSPAVPSEGSMAVSVALRYTNTKRKTDFIAVDGTNTRGGLTFQFYPAELVSGIQPYEGPSRGGTRLTITGTDFRDTPDLVAYFTYSGALGSDGSTKLSQDTNLQAATAIVSARYVSSKEVTADAPPCPLGPGASAFFSVGISSNSADIPNRPDGPLYFFDASEPFVELLSPTIVRESGGVALTIRGFGFPETYPSTLACRFGGGDEEVTVSATRHSTEVLTCVSPSLRPGPVAVRVTSYGQAIASDGDLMVEYVSDLQISSSWPTLGPAGGGTAVTVLGQGFREEETYACAFGSLRSTPTGAALLNSSAVVCHAPAALGREMVTLQVLTVQNDTFFPSRGYVYSLPSTETLTGVALTATAAAGGNESAASASLTYRYHDDVEITQVRPSNGPASGGTVVRVSGSGFLDLPEAACRFGAGDPTPATVLNPGTLVCTAGSFTAATGIPVEQGPANGFHNRSRAQRAVEVRVAMNGVDFAPINTSLSFVYDEDITVVALVPDRGPATGGVRVVVRGSGFRPDERLACRFGLQEVAAKYIRSDTIACLSPPQVRVSRVSVSVTLNGQDFCSGTHGAAPTPSAAGESGELGGALFTYTDRAAVTSLTPDRGPTRGGTVVTVSGVNFADSSTLLCRFGDLVTTVAVFVSTEVVSCVSPAVPAGAAGRVFLEVSDRGSAATSNDLTSSFGSAQLVNLQEPGDDPALWTDSRVGFTFGEDPVVLAAFPASGPSEGGTRISLTGFGFQDLPELGCRFGGARSLNSPDERFEAVDDGERPGTETAAEVFEATAVDVPATFVSPTEVMCVSPEQSLEWNNGRDSSGGPSSPAEGAIVRVAVTLNGQDYGLRMAQFVYYPAPNVFSASPDRGPRSGGTMVKVSGVNLTSAGAYPGFTNGSLLCRFGGPGGEIAEASPVVGGSDDAVQCVAPPDPQQDGGGTEA